MGRTNIPIHLPPGSLSSHGNYSNIDSSFVTLTPLSPPSRHRKVSPPPSRSPTLTTAPLYLNLIHINPFPWQQKLWPASHSTSHIYTATSIPYATQNGSLPPQPFLIVTSRLFQDGSTEPFQFKFGTSSGSSTMTNVPNTGTPNSNPFHFQSSAANGVEASPRTSSKSERNRFQGSGPAHQPSTNQNNRRESHDDSPMMGVVIQR